MLRHPRVLVTTTLWTLLLAGCGDDNGDGPSEATLGDTVGDGDGDPTGDGDGDPTGDGDGDPTGDGDGDPTGDGDGDPTGDGDGDGDPTCSGASMPQGQAELNAWLEGGGYRGWSAESGVHPSDGPHFGGVRTYVDTCLAGSLAADASEHPVDAVAVKELYGNGDAIRGWAVMRKVAPGSGGDSWYWYEIYDDSVFADAIGANLCTGCHGGGTDFVLTPWPLQ
jgi:hypothetical protein